jgi:hypothetical protein
VRRANNLATFMCRLSTNSGSLNLLEPPGSVQACTGTALPFICRLEMELQYTGYKRWPAVLPFIPECTCESVSDVGPSDRNQNGFTQLDGARIT